jgi:hypothetical protein
VEGEWAGKAAIDIALMDWVGQKLGVPLYRYFGLDPRDTPVTTFSIGIDNPETTRQKVREAADFPVLKIKVGLDTDEATIAAVRSVTDKPLRVDANEGWKDKEVAVRKIDWLAGQGVEFVEQPMPAEMLEEMRWVHSRVHVPLIADEACRHASDIPKLAGAFDGVNVKLDKSGRNSGSAPHDPGGQIARHENHAGLHGVELRIGDGAAHLSPLVDYADLDGNLLICQRSVHGSAGGEGQAGAAGPDRGWGWTAGPTAIVTVLEVTPPMEIATGTALPAGAPAGTSAFT